MRTVMSFLSFIIAFWAAKTLSTPFSDYIYTRFIQPNFAAKAVTQIEGFLTRNINLHSLVTNPNPPDNFVTMLKGYGFNLPDIQKLITDAASKTGDELNKFVADNIVEPLARSISYFIAFAAILIAAYIVLKIVVLMIDRIAKLPGLNIINRTGGILLGFLYGIALCYIFVFLASYALPYFVAQNAISSSADVINSSIFFKWFYEHSPLDYILSLF